jgi:hypothetical protein
MIPNRTPRAASILSQNLLARMVVVVLEATLVFALTFSTRAAENSDVIKGVKELYDNSQKLLDWADWSVDTGLRMLDENPKPAHPVPGGLNGDKFEKLLIETTEKVDALTLASFSYVDADLTNIGALPRDEMRAKLRGAIASFQIPIRELTKSRTARSSLDRMLRQAVAQNSALRQTADLAPEIIQKFPTEVIYVEFTVQFGSINFSFIPLNEKLQKTIKAKQDEFDGDITKEASELKQIGHYIAQALKTEQEELTSDLDEIKKTAEALNQRRKDIDAKKNDEDRVKRELSTTSAYVQALELDIQQSEADADNARARVQGIQNDINSANQRIQQLWQECGYITPSGQCYAVPYYEMNRWIDQLNAAKAELSQAQSALGPAQVRLRQIEANLDRQNEQLRQEEQVRQNKANQLAALQREVLGLQSQWDADFKAAEEEKWKSRADVYMSQSLQDQHTVDASLSGL